MHLSGDLGFSSLVLVVCLVFPLIGFVIRRKWRIAAVRKEEIKRLLVLASEEAARAELEASASYGTVSISRGYHCAVCFCPTTTRCARCKVVRYWYVILSFSFFFCVLIRSFPHSCVVISSFACRQYIYILEKVSSFSALVEFVSRYVGNLAVDSAVCSIFT